MSTDAQRAANQANAQKSTGPRTEAGKIASAANATSHGLFATRPVAVRRGPYAEDPEQVAAWVDRVVLSLEPRDTIEEAAAQEIAVLLLRGQRLGVYEADALAGVASQAAQRVDRQTNTPTADREELKFEAAALEGINAILDRTSEIGVRHGRALDRAYDNYYRLRIRSETLGVSDPGHRATTPIAMTTIRTL